MTTHNHRALTILFFGMVVIVGYCYSSAETTTIPKDDSATAVVESLNSLLRKISMTRHTIEKNTSSVPQSHRHQKQEIHVKKSTKRINRKEQEAIVNNNNCTLLGAVGHRIPNSESICSCSSENALDLTCHVINDACSNSSTNNNNTGGVVCANVTVVHMNLSLGSISMEYCSEFSSSSSSDYYDDTCVTLELNSAGNQIESCEATYGSANNNYCDCHVCDDQSSISVDCSRFNCRAVTPMNGCQAIDLTSELLVTVVPDFQSIDWICPTTTTASPMSSSSPLLLPSVETTTPVDVTSTPLPATLQNPQRPPPTPAVTPPTTARPVSTNPPYSGGGGSNSGAGSSSDATTAAASSDDDYDDDFVAEPFPPPGADQNCYVFSLAADELPPNSLPIEDLCYCDSSTSLACRFYGRSTRGIRANQVDARLDGGDPNNPKTSYCSLFKGNIFEETCIEFQGPARDIQSCEVTYGGNPCDCTVCTDVRSLIIDCSMHHPDATTSACQVMPTKLVPVIPRFQVSDGEDDNNSNDLGECSWINILQGQLENPEEKCQCIGRERVDCVEEDYCYTNSRSSENSRTCAENIDISIDTSRGNGVTITHCTRFDTERNDGQEFEDTCVELSADIEFDLRGCIRATYGGRECSTCNVCTGRNAIEIDCTEYNENAWIPYQLMFDRQERLLPFVPHFMGSVDGSNDDLSQLTGCSSAGATIMITAQQAATTSMLAIVMTFVYMII